MKAYYSLTSLSVPGRPPGSVAGDPQEPPGKIKLPDIIFDVRNEILTLKIYI